MHYLKIDIVCLQLWGFLMHDSASGLDIEWDIMNYGLALLVKQ